LCKTKMKRTVISIILVKVDSGSAFLPRS
jgi:hypothetical protein